MESEIRFKALNKGIGLYESSPEPYSHYKNEDEDHLLSSYSQDVFFNLDLSGSNYDELLKRLEKPILNKFNNQNIELPLTSGKRKSQVLEKKNLSKETSLIFESDSPLGQRQLPPFGVMRLDYGFSIGLYLIGWSILAGVFHFNFIPSILISVLSYGLFHQLYVVLCRSFMGATLGEERYNLGWSHSSIIRFIARGLFVMLTGFILIPILSALFKRDLFQEYTGLRLRYNI